jgi:hypothetical protein
MLSAGWLVAAVLVAVLLTGWVTFTVTRLDRLHARVDAAQAALDAQLVRRAGALLHVAETAGDLVHDDQRIHLEAVAGQALSASLDDREAVENAVGRAVVELAAEQGHLTTSATDELREAGARVLIARRFYNDAVRDTRALRGRRMPRLLRLAGHRDMPQFFDIDDTLPTYDPPDHDDTTGARTGADPAPQEETAR